MIVNMQCPKCGGQASEYDENKWRCLKCGNKFIFAPVAPAVSQTFVQSSVHIQGQATFELDVQNAKPPVPRTVKMIDHDPDHFGKRIAENAGKIVTISHQLSSEKSKKTTSKVFIILLGSIIALIILGASVGPPDKPGESDTGAAIGSSILLGLLMLWPISAFSRHSKEVSALESLIQQYQQEAASLERQNQQDTRVGDNIVCPHCEAVSIYVPLNSPPPLDGLKHCFECGKQFFTTRLNSYPVLFK